MTDKLRGAFHGCPHHGDDYEACIQHSGTAPCGVTEERDYFERLAGERGAARDKMCLERDEYRNHLAIIAEMTGEGDDIGAAWESVNALQEALVASEKREQAMAAHVGRLTVVAEKLSTVAPEYIDHLASDASFVLREAPTTSLAQRDDEQFRQGFWWGFERARCHPDQMNIRAEYEEVASLRTQRRQAGEAAQ